MKHTQEDLTFAQKVKMVGTMALVGFIAVVSVGGYTVYQREAKAEAVKTAAVQLANVESIKAVLPLFRGVKDMAIVKVKQSALPKTITAGLNPAKDPNPECDAGYPEYWVLSLPDSTYADSNEPGVWIVSSGGDVTVPILSPVGTYGLLYVSDEECGLPGSFKNYHYTFKITPPCPTGVTLTH